MKKLGLLVLSFLFTSLFMVDVNATSVVVDPNENIKMPYNLFVDSTNYITFDSSLSGATKSYQIVDVSGNTEIVSYIDGSIMPLLNSLHDAEVEFGKYEAGTTESTNANNNIEFVKSSIDDSVKSDNFKTLVPDYNDVNWLSLSENVIPTNNIKKDGYYIVWVKADNAGATTYEYHAYKALNSNYYSNSNSNTNNEVENPDTGIEHTLLFITVGALVLVGSGLVVNRNKESY